MHSPTRTSLLLLAAVSAAFSASPTIAVIGLQHSHVWGHLPRMIGGSPARLVGISETNPSLIAEARKMGAPAAVFFKDDAQMLDAVKPDIVWAFTPNNGHLRIVKLCAPRKINVMFEKPLASTLADARAIRVLAKRHGIAVLTNYQMAWWPSNYLARERAGAGELGQVWRLRGIVGHGGPGSEGPRNSVFFGWLTDPVQNGAGALMDFGCYNALWSLWYLGRPESVYAHVNHLRPAIFPKVEDNSTMILSYKNGVGLFEGSWDLPRSFQELEVFGLEGSATLTRDRLEIRKGRGAAVEAPLQPLAPENAEPIAHMIAAMRDQKPLNPMVALDINVDVVEIIEALKKSVATKAAVRLPLR
ncbi:MAG: Gfo/Idh/MocA family oxidoreductase [Bryobacterales bacterium]|nr:Gfo/Idh/MocA family oxidoreductase [Bryobacterales bacterium]